MARAEEQVKHDGTQAESVLPDSGWCSWPSNRLADVSGEPDDAGSCLGRDGVEGEQHKLGAF